MDKKIKWFTWVVIIIFLIWMVATFISINLWNNTNNNVVKTKKDITTTEKKSPKIQKTKKIDIEGVKIFRQKIENICKENSSMDELLTKNKKDFTDAIQYYQDILKWKTNDQIAGFKKVMDNIIWNACYKYWATQDMERLAEQIRRGDYTTMADKNKITKKYIDLYLKKDINKVLKLIKQWELNKENFTDKVLEQDNPNNPFYLIIHNRYNWNKITDAGLWFKPKELETKFMIKLIWIIDNKILPAVGLDRETFKKQIFKKLGISDIKWLEEKIVALFIKMKDKYHLADHLPIDRGFTKKERKKAFQDEVSLLTVYGDLLRNKDFVSNLKKLRLYDYLLIYLDDTKKNWSSRYREKNMWYWHGIQNIFRMGRYVGEPFEFNINVKN